MALAGASVLVLFVFLLLLLVLLLMLFAITLLSLESTASSMDPLLSGASVNGFVAGNEFVAKFVDMSVDAVAMATAAATDA